MSLKYYLLTIILSLLLYSYCKITIQWNPSIADSIGTNINVLNTGMSSIRVYSIEGFHCISIIILIFINSLIKYEYIYNTSCLYVSHNRTLKSISGSLFL